MSATGRSISIILASYNMERELPRTLYSLSRLYQRDVDRYIVDVTVIDNGSRTEVLQSAVQAILPNAVVTRPGKIRASPVRALNDAVAMTRGENIGIFIDAARMASPGLIDTAMRAIQLDGRSVVGALSFHLGRLPQNDSVRRGYDQAVEDRLLSTVDWREDGYELFNISSLDPSSRFGFFASPIETNSLFLRRDMWAESGGFDDRFESRGGGLANLDLWKRLSEDTRNQTVLLLGEGTFHQIHGGVSTNAAKSPWEEFEHEYQLIRGQRYTEPVVEPLLFGSSSGQWQDFLARRHDSERKRNLLRRRIPRRVKIALGL